jgi:hypothetical protein
MHPVARLRMVSTAYNIGTQGMLKTMSAVGSTSQTPWGPEAGRFLSALQDLIASIVRSQSNSGSKNIIEVDLNGMFL